MPSRSTTQVGSRTEPAFWWINDYVHDRDADQGILWTPAFSRSGARLRIWETIHDLNRGDCLIHYSVAQGGILNQASVVIEEAREAVAPQDHVLRAEPRSGFAVRVTVVDFQKPIALSDIAKSVLGLATDAIKPNRHIRHGYAISLPQKFATELIDTFAVEWPNAFRSMAPRPH